MFLEVKGQLANPHSQNEKKYCVNHLLHLCCKNIWTVIIKNKEILCLWQLTDTKFVWLVNLWRPLETFINIFKIIAAQNILRLKRNLNIWHQFRLIQSLFPQRATNVCIQNNIQIVKKIFKKSVYSKTTLFI